MEVIWVWQIFLCCFDFYCGHVVGYPDLLLFCNLLDKHSSLLYQEDKVSPLSAREEMCSGKQSGLTGVAWWEGYLPRFLCVQYVRACLPARPGHAVDGVGSPPLIPLLRAHLQVAATTSCQASNAVGFGMISEHKFITTVGVWG